MHKMESLIKQADIQTVQPGGTKYGDRRLNFSRITFVWANAEEQWRV